MASLHVSECEDMASRLRGFDAAEDAMHAPQKDPKVPKPDGKHPQVDIGVFSFCLPWDGFVLVLTCLPPTAANVPDHTGTDNFLIWWLRYRTFLLGVRNYLASLVGISSLELGDDFGLSNSPMSGVVAEPQFAVEPPPKCRVGLAADDEAKEAVSGVRHSPPPPIMVDAGVSAEGDEGIGDSLVLGAQKSDAGNVQPSIQVIKVGHIELTTPLDFSLERL